MSGWVVDSADCATVNVEFRHLDFHQVPFAEPPGLADGQDNRVGYEPVPPAFYKMHVLVGAVTFFVVADAGVKINVLGHGFGGAMYFKTRVGCCTSVGTLPFEMFQRAHVGHRFIVLQVKRGKSFVTEVVTQPKNNARVG
jgi:hypothetical protein